MTSVFLLFLPLFFPASDAFASEALTISRELHWAVTEQKFELAMERLRVEKKPRRRAPVILSHGLLATSLFFNLDEDHSLGRYLAKEGFDVWNLSLRGTGRSLEPLKGGAKRWTMDEIAEQDLPAVIRYVQKESGNCKAVWVGFEMGGLLAYGAITKGGVSELAGLVTIAAPVTFTHPEQGPMKRLLKLEESPGLKKLFLSLNTPFLARLILPLVPAIERLFYNPDNIQNEVKQKLLEEALAEINPGILDHLLVMIKRGEFVSADGTFNYRKNLDKIRLPLLLIGGERDALAPPEAIRSLHRAAASADRTVRIFGLRSKDSEAYGHLDLIVGKKSRQEVFPEIARWLRQKDGCR